MDSVLIIFTALAVILAAGVITALVVASRQTSLGLGDQNREPSSRFDPQGAPQGWGHFRSVTTRDRASLEATSEAAIHTRAQATADVAHARALEAEARAAARVAERDAARERLRGQVLPPATQVVAATAGGPPGSEGSSSERSYTLAELKDLKEVLGTVQPQKGGKGGKREE